MTDFSEATRRTNTTNTAISALAVVWDVLDYERGMSNVEIIGLASICKLVHQKAKRILRIRKAKTQKKSEY